MKNKDYTALGIALGAGIGTALDVTMNNIGVWLSNGIGVGVAIGAGMSRAHKKENTEDEQDSFFKQ